MVPVIANVLARRQEAPDVVTLTLQAAGWPGFAPGQFNMLGLPGVGEVAISFSGKPDVDNTITHTIRAVGPVSRALTALEPGEWLTLRGPYGLPWPMERAEGRDVVVAAGGLGMAPLRPAVYHLLTHRERYGKITLLYGTRSPEDILYLDELRDWRSRLDLEVGITVDHAGPDWHGHVGVVTKLMPGADFDPATTTAYLCGPEIMMRFAAVALANAGVAGTEIFLSMERNMQCGIGLCGHCQLGPHFVCRDGPVFDWTEMQPLMAIKEL